jgi:hypothetical protein
MKKNGKPPSGNGKATSWERQVGETEKAHEGFLCYLELGTGRSVRRVAAKLHKRSTLIGRWSKKHNWVKRAREYDNFRLAGAEGSTHVLEQKLLRDAMSRNEVLLRTSFLGRATLNDALDDAGAFDIKKARKTGVIHALKKIAYYPSGKVKVIELRDKSSSIELMGKYHGVWTGDIGDPDEIFQRLLGIPKQLIPAKLDDSVNLQLNRSGTYVVPGADEEEEIEGPVEEIGDKNQ